MDGSKWTALDSRNNQSWKDSERGVTKTFQVGSPGNNTYYRLDISSNHSGGILQLAGWGMNAAIVAGTTRTPMVTLVGAGPSCGYHIIPLAGFTGMRALKHAGQHTADGRG